MGAEKSLFDLEAYRRLLLSPDKPPAGARNAKTAAPRPRATRKTVLFILEHNSFVNSLSGDLKITTLVRRLDFHFIP